MTIIGFRISHVTSAIYNQCFQLIKDLYFQENFAFTRQWVRQFNILKIKNLMTCSHKKILSSGLEYEEIPITKRKPQITHWKQ